MSSQQRYISKELTHFVARQKETTDEQYIALSEILKQGQLSHSPDKPFQAGIGVEVNHKAKMTDNDMFVPDMVCFCDIPLGDLDLHIQKYSCFGLSFKKDFIVAQGGSPVFYIPKKAAVRHSHVAKHKGEHFDKLSHSIYNYFTKSLCKPPDNLLSAEREQFSDYSILLAFHIFSYLKFFDHTLEDDHRDNYYFEREWRVLGSLDFSIEDVHRIIMPNSYAEKFRQDFPEYYGQLTSVNLQQSNKDILILINRIKGFCKVVDALKNQGFNADSFKSHSIVEHETPNPKDQQSIWIGRKVSPTLAIQAINIVRHRWPFLKYLDFSEEQNSQLFFGGSTKTAIERSLKAWTEKDFDGLDGVRGQVDFHAYIRQRYSQ